MTHLGNLLQPAGTLGFDELVRDRDCMWNRDFNCLTGRNAHPCSVVSRLVKFFFAANGSRKR